MRSKRAIDYERKCDLAKIKTRKVGSIEKLQEALKKGSGNWLIQSVPKDDSITVRFLTEPEDWIGYDEVWDNGLRKFYPAPEGFVADDDQKVSQKYLANVVTSDNKVVALRLPRDLCTRLLNRADRYGTMMDRDYELERFGEGFDTTYDVTPDSPSKRSLKKFKPLDLNDVLQQTYDEAFPGDDEDEEEKFNDKDIPKSQRSKSSRTSPKRKKKVVEEEEEPEEEEPEEDEGDEDDYITIYDDDELDEMKMSELRAVGRDLGVKGIKKKDDLVEAILDAQEDLLDDE